MNRNLLTACLGFALFFSALYTHGQVHEPDSGGAQQLAIPSYIYPCNAANGCYWTQLLNGAPTVGIAIINPYNGPGTSLDTNYQDQVLRARAQGVKILGYVHTTYGHRTLPTVKAEIDRYYTWYAVDGIFVDEASTNCWQRKYYISLNTFIKARGGANRSLVALNPGTHTNECYLTSQTSDIFVTFEGSFSSYLNWQMQGWEANYPAQRFWHLVYDTTAAQMPQAVCLSKQRNIGYIYVTPDELVPNPWDSLPTGSYWSTLLQLTAAMNCPASKR
jgi:Spherulation-specific family 4.